jgi:hypothetical protein
MAEKSTYSTTMVGVHFDAQLSVQKIIEAAPMVSQPFMAVRIDTDEYRIDQGSAISAPYSEVNAQVLISATGEYISSDRAEPADIDTKANYRFLPSSLGATQWDSESYNVGFTYPSGKAPELVERTWNSGKEVITRAGARIDSDNSEVLASDFSILGQQYSYAIAFVIEPNSNDYAFQTIASTSGSTSPWSLVAQDKALYLSDSENPWDLSNDAYITHGSIYGADVPMVVVVSVLPDRLSLHSLTKDGRLRTSSVPVSYEDPDVISILVGTDPKHYMGYADSVIYEIDLYTEINDQFDPVSVINEIEEAYGVRQW